MADITLDLMDRVQNLKNRRGLHNNAANGYFSYLFIPCKSSAIKQQL